MPGIFLSHSSKDKPAVFQLASDLVFSGFPVWLDRWEMEAGDSFVKEIFEGVDSSSFLIVALTPNAVASDWVKRELAAALEREQRQGKKFVLPVQLAPCDLPHEKDGMARRFPLEIRQRGRWRNLEVRADHGWCPGEDLPEDGGRLRRAQFDNGNGL